MEEKNDLPNIQPIIKKRGRPAGAPKIIQGIPAPAAPGENRAPIPMAEPLAVVKEQHVMTEKRQASIGRARKVRKLKRDGTAKASSDEIDEIMKFLKVQPPMFEQLFNKVELLERITNEMNTKRDRINEHDLLPVQNPTGDDPNITTDILTDMELPMKKPKSYLTPVKF